MTEETRGISEYGLYVEGKYICGFSCSACVPVWEFEWNGALL